MAFQLREIYAKVVYTSNLTDSAEYKECLKLLEFLSKEELLSKLKSIVKIIDCTDPTMKKIKSDLDIHINTIDMASLQTTTAVSEMVTVDKKLNRTQLKEVCARSCFLIILKLHEYLHLKYF